LASLGFYDGSTSFGVVKKGEIHLCSDFNFTITAEVICKISSNSGYLVELTPQGQDSATRYIYLVIYN